MKKETKGRVNFTMDLIFYDKFREIANKKAINKSKLVEQLLKNWMKENEKK